MEEELAGRISFRTGRTLRTLGEAKVNTGSTEAAYEVDALSGATFTTKGVENMINFWAGDLGFGPLIQNFERKTRGSSLRQNRYGKSI